MAIVRVHIFIEGKVQGVFYRSWLKGQAESLGLTGWVKNLEDGRVEAIIQGPKEKVEDLVQKCRQGSSVSRVSHTDVIYEEVVDDLIGFSIIS